MMANWVLASHHSRGGIFHVCATWRKTRYSNLIAASSVGKCPLVRTFHAGSLQGRYKALMLDGVVLARKTGAGRCAARCWWLWACGVTARRR